jgi:hypothetical protein
MCGRLARANENLRHIAPSPAEASISLRVDADVLE